MNTLLIILFVLFLPLILTVFGFFVVFLFISIQYIWELNKSIFNVFVETIKGEVNGNSKKR